MSDSPVRSLLITIAGVISGFALIAAVLVGCMVSGGHSGSLGGSSGSVSGSGGSPSPTIAVPKVSAAEMAKLPRAATDGTVKKAIVDLKTASHGQLVEISRDVVGFSAPGGSPITRIPSKQFGTTIWLPVIATKDNWVQVRLPSRPNGGTAWIPSDGLQRAATQWSVQISLKRGMITIMDGGKSVGEWPIGQGRNATPTPVGETFLFAPFVDPDASFSPVIYATGSHSDTLDTFGGGPGTVAVHGWPTAAGRTGKVSHGCVRVPADALQAFSKLPLGTPIDISQ